MSKITKGLYSLFLLFLMLPFVSLVLWSFVTKWSAGEPIFTNITVDGWRYFFQSGDIKNVLQDSLYAGFIALLSTVLSLLCGRAMVLAHGHSKLVEALFYFPLLFPPIAILIGFHRWTLTRFPYPSLVLIMAYLFFSFPYSFRIIYTAYKTGLKEKIDTAYNLGANHLQIIIQIEVPLLAKHLLSAFTLAYGVCYGQYLVAIFFDSSRFVVQMTHFLGSNNRNISSIYTLVYIVFAFMVFAPIFVYGKIKPRRDSHLSKSGSDHL